MTVGADSPVALSAAHYAECGFSVFPLVPGSKRPAVTAWQKTDYRFPDEAQEALAGCEGLGVVLTARDLVIDVDPRNFKPGDKPHVRLFEDAGIKPKDYAAFVKTGSGGLHLYFRLPAGINIRKKIPVYPGIDFLSLGAYVVGAGSVHPDTRKVYEWLAGRQLRDALEAPDALIRICQRFGPEGRVLERDSAPDAPSDVRDQRNGSGGENDPDAVQTYRLFLENCPPAVQGQSGDAQTLKVCLKGRDLGLTAEQTLALVAEIYNPRCIPEWRPEELAFKVRNAYTYAREKAGNALAVNDFQVVRESVKNPLFRGFDTTNGGKAAKTLNNAFNYFIMDDSPIKRIIAWDEFNGQVKLMRPAPWTELEVPAEGLEWSDTDSTLLRLWLGREKRVDFPTEVIDKAVLAAAQLHKVHPVRDFLDGLVWDKVPRLESWLVKYAGAKDTAFVRQASEKVLLQAVNRIFNPGCKADYVLVLEGNQGVGKSSLIEILGGKWYADIVIDPHGRDTADALRGKWFVELSEMEVTKRADAQALKAFITRKVDRFRLAYGRRAVDLPRQCTFVGTINPDATNEYLADSTGNRRFWPVWIRQVDFNGLSAVRDQLFAEAVASVKAGKATHILDKAALVEAAHEQKMRQTSDPWVEAVQEWVAEQKIEFVSTKDVWMYALRGKESELSLAHQRRIAGVLREIGWEQHVRKQNGIAQRGYRMIGAELLA